MIFGMKTAEHRVNRTGRFAASVLGLVALFSVLGAAAAAIEPPTVDARSIAGDLRKGGYVIYVRHGLTEQVGATDEAADFSRCETQRNLSDAGRAQARAIGKAVKALGIPVGAVEASPFCRTKETADLAFGRHRVNTDLVFVMNSDATESKRLGAALRRMISTVPASRTNTVLVSHSANLREAAGIFAKPEGAAYIFRPLGGGRFEPIARILPDGWDAAAARTAAAKTP
jgi:broad specificity phosphatase PhoE